jgi:hypothetical protein
VGSYYLHQAIKAYKGAKFELCFIDADEKNSTAHSSSSTSIQNPHGFSTSYSIC